MEINTNTMTPPEANYAAWDKCRELGKQLAQAIQETGEDWMAYIRPAGHPFPVAFGCMVPSSVEQLIEAHRLAHKQADEHWSKTWEIEDSIHEKLPFVRVKIGTMRRMGMDPEVIWAYDENDVIKKTAGHIRGALNEYQRKCYEEYRDKLLNEIRELAAQREAIKAESGLTQMETIGKEMDQKHRDLFEQIVAMKPATLDEARIKIGYIAHHLEDMDEAMNEEEAITLLRALV